MTAKKQKSWEVSARGNYNVLENEMKITLNTKTKI